MVCNGGLVQQMKHIGIIGWGKMGRLHGETVSAMGHLATEMSSHSIVNAVVVSSPDNTHAKYVKEFLRVGKPVFCEKPIATNIDDLDEIEELAKKTPLGCHLPLRQWDVPVAPGNIELLYHYGRRTKFLLGWRNDPSYDLVLGGGIHMVDWILGKLRPAAPHPTRASWMHHAWGARTPDMFTGVIKMGNSIVNLTVDFLSDDEHYHQVKSDSGIYKNTQEMDKTSQLKAFIENPQTDWRALRANRLCIEFRAVI